MRNTHARALIKNLSVRNEFMKYYDKFIRGISGEIKPMSYGMVDRLTRAANYIYFTDDFIKKEEERLLNCGLGKNDVNNLISAFFRSNPVLVLSVLKSFIDKKPDNIDAYNIFRLLERFYQLGNQPVNRDEISKYEANLLLDFALSIDVNSESKNRFICELTLGRGYKDFEMNPINALDLNCIIRDGNASRYIVKIVLLYSCDIISKNELLDAINTAEEKWSSECSERYNSNNNASLRNDILSIKSELLSENDGYFLITSNGNWKPLTIVYDMNKAKNRIENANNKSFDYINQLYMLKKFNTCFRLELLSFAFRGCNYGYNTDEPEIISDCYNTFYKVLMDDLHKTGSINAAVEELGIHYENINNAAFFSLSTASKEDYIAFMYYSLGRAYSEGNLDDAKALYKLLKGDRNRAGGAYNLDSEQHTSPYSIANALGFLYEMTGLDVEPGFIDFLFEKENSLKEIEKSDTDNTYTFSRGLCLGNNSYGVNYVRRYNLWDMYKPFKVFKEGIGISAFQKTGKLSYYWYDSMVTAVRELANKGIDANPHDYSLNYSDTENMLPGILRIIYNAAALSVSTDDAFSKYSPSEFLSSYIPMYSKII